jgi:hypothetical protein
MSYIYEKLYKEGQKGIITGDYILFLRATRAERKSNP